MSRLQLNGVAELSGSQRRGMCMCVCTTATQSNAAFIFPSSFSHTPYSIQHSVLRTLCLNVNASLREGHPASGRVQVVEETPDKDAGHLQHIHRVNDWIPQSSVRSSFFFFSKGDLFSRVWISVVNDLICLLMLDGGTKYPHRIA